MSKNSNRASKVEYLTATVSLTIAGRTFTATAATRNEALVALNALIDQAMQPYLTDSEQESN